MLVILGSDAKGVAPIWLYTQAVVRSMVLER